MRRVAVSVFFVSMLFTPFDCRRKIAAGAIFIYDVN
jgi:hypothetical protein